jgi:hypothetical protein
MLQHLSSYNYFKTGFFFFFFFLMYTKEGDECLYSDLRFMRRGPQPIKLSLGDTTLRVVFVI